MLGRVVESIATMCVHYYNILNTMVEQESVQIAAESSQVHVDDIVFRKEYGVEYNAPSRES